jgi:hypothetical protein
VPDDELSSVDEAAERLYGLALADFTRERDAAAAALRKEGRREEADEVKRLPKPTTAAWAANQLVRRHSDTLAAFLDAASALRDAQFRGKGDLDRATRAERDALSRLVAAAKSELSGAASRAVVDRVRETLQAAAVDDAAAQELTSGRLARELEPAGFGSLLAHVPDKLPQRERKAASAKPDAQAIKRAQTQVDRAEGRLERAERERDRLRGLLGEAEAAVAEAKTELTQAREALERAKQNG